MLNLSLPEWISIISTIATLFMVIATWKMARITQITLEEHSKPYVLVYPRQDKAFPSGLEIVIENMGATPAYDIQFTFSDNLFYNAGGIEKPDRQPAVFINGAFIEGIKYLPPKGKRVFFWGQFSGISESLNGKSAQVIAVFNNASGKARYSTVNTLEIKDFLGVTANDSIELRQLNTLKLLPEKMDKLIHLLDKKLHPQSSETTYMWAYITWFLLKGRGFSKAHIFRVGHDAGLTEEQIQNAENEASSILRHYCPEQFIEKDEK